MGQSKSKALPYPQYSLPPGYPQYGHVYQYPVVPQVAYAPGYHAPVIPPGYGQVVMPQPVATEVKSQRQKKQKHTSSSSGRKDRSSGHRRHHSAPLNVQPAPAGMFDNLPPGFVPNSIIPNIPGGTNPVIPQAPHATTAQEPPIRRAPTPWVNSVPSDTSDEEDESQQRTSHHQSHSLPRHRNRSISRYRSDPRSEITADHPRAALDFREPNPLPPPPRDIFANSPYRHLLHLTDTTTHPSTARVTNFVNDPSKMTISRSATLPGLAGVGAGVNAALPTTKKKRGLFSFGSRRGRRNQSAAPEPVPKHAHGYVQAVYPNMTYPRSAPGHAPVVGFNDVSRAHSPEAQRSPPFDDDESSDEDHLPPSAHRSTTPGPSHPYPQPGQTSHQSHPSQSYPVLSPSQPFLFSPNGSTIEFSQRSLPEFLNHSPHRVMYENKTYPTAMHLHEAMKFIEHKPDLAETIRQCEGIEDVYPAALSFQVWVRPDWGTVFLEKMEDVLWAKFTQHPDLRSTLLKTGDCRIVYADTQDIYWGSGSDIGHPGNYPGHNYLGKLLEKVRDRLRIEGYPA